MLDLADFLELADDGLDDGAFGEEEFLERRALDRFHVAPGFGDEPDAHFGQLCGHLFGDVALVASGQSVQFPEQFRYRVTIIGVAWRQAESHDLAPCVDHHMQLEAIKPAHGGLAALGNAFEGLVPVDALVAANPEGRAVDIIEPGLMAAFGFQEGAKGRKDPPLDLDKPIVGQQLGETAPHLARHAIQIEVLEVPVMAQVEQDHDGHDFARAHGKGALTFAVIAGQKIPLELREKSLAEIINFTENLFDGSHGTLHDWRESLKIEPTPINNPCESMTWKFLIPNPG